MLNLFTSFSSTLNMADTPKSHLNHDAYRAALDELQVRLVNLQGWMIQEGLKVVVIFEGRDAAGKGGAIKRIAQRLNPRYCRVAALAKPTERERGQWYFQRYVEHLPTKGEMVLFDRSWYNRAGVEKVMGFCTDEEHEEFLLSCPEFEQLLVRSGIILIKYWFSISPEEQERRFQSRITDPTKRWKLSPVDMASRLHWAEFSKARDTMLERTDTGFAPWYLIEGDDKRRTRLNCISHLLETIPHGVVNPEAVDLPPRQSEDGYARPDRNKYRYVPEKF